MPNGVAEVVGEWMFSFTDVTKCMHLTMLSDATM